MKIHVLNQQCKGPNARCRRDARDGRHVHLIPMSHVGEEPQLVMPTYHYATEAQGRAAITAAWETAEVIRTREQLNAARRDGRPHKLAVGWIDPTRR
jgi:hypothetical protein